jgi:hypothetical protein
MCMSLCEADEYRVSPADSYLRTSCLVADKAAPPSELSGRDRMSRSVLKIDFYQGATQVKSLEDRRRKGMRMLKRGASQADVVHMGLVDSQLRDGPGCLLTILLHGARRSGADRLD